MTTLEGPILVIAGAGSGKTRTLVYRLAYLVEHGVDPGAILLLTFTRKASREMLTRAVHLLNQALGQVVGGTFHGICYLWLRQYGERLGYPKGFTVMDRADQGDLLNLLKERLGFKKLSGPFPRKETMGEILGAVVNKDLSLDFLLPGITPSSWSSGTTWPKWPRPTRTKSAATPCWTMMTCCWKAGAC